MSSSRTLIAVFGLCVAAGCGSSPEPKSSDDVDTEELSYVDQADTPADSVAKVPERCVKRGNACVPAINWALSVCEDVYEDLALYMFREGTPWSRFYLKTSLNAVNGWGTTLHEDMVSREEVLVINHRLSSNSFQVEGSGGTYDVLRWNGSCVTVDVNEVTPKAPYKPRNSRIEWRALSNEMRKALLKDEKVATTHEKRRKACKGASVGRATKQCEELDKYFMEVVADAVRHTEDLPLPSRAPSLPARSARN